MSLLRFLGISGSHPFIEGEHMLKYLNEQLLLEISLKTNRFKIFVRVSFLLQFFVLQQDITILRILNRVWICVKYSHRLIYSSLMAF